jgi:hypothetical protein
MVSVLEELLLVQDTKTDQMVVVSIQFYLSRSRLQGCAAPLTLLPLPRQQQRLHAAPFIAIGLNGRYPWEISRNGAWINFTNFLFPTLVVLTCVHSDRDLFESIFVRTTKGLSQLLE